MDNYNLPPNYTQQIALSMSQVMKRVYLKMTLGLFVTGVVAFLLCMNTVGDPRFSAYNYFMYEHHSLMWLLLLAEIGIVFAISSALRKMSAATATVLFYVFAVVNGLALSPIVALYTGVSLAKTFFITAGTFGAMTVYGYLTNNDLSRIGSILYMALFGLIICIIVNMFLKSSQFDWIISFLGVAIFIGLTAWDTQRIKQLVAMSPSESYGAIATIGALNLYLDFINLFLYLLRFFGNSRD